MDELSSLQKSTSEHYDSHPFEFLTKKDEDNIEQIQPTPFVYFVKNYLKKTDQVIDVGCGGGRATLYLKRSGINTYAFDLSLQSLKLTAARCQGAAFTCGTNLALPFQTDSFNAVVSDGVIHHTPDAKQSLKENIRILKQNGHLYLAVYKKEGYYYYVYTFLGKPARWLAKNKFGRMLVNYGLGFPYYFLHLFKKKSPTTWRGSLNFFYDYLLTPQATFYKKAEIQTLAESLGLQTLFYDHRIGNVHIFIFKKRVRESL